MARMRIVIEEAGVEMTAELNDSATAAAVWSALPVESAVSVEHRCYGPRGVRPGNPQAARDLGRRRLLATGKAVCLFLASNR